MTTIGVCLGRAALGLLWTPEEEEDRMNEEAE